MDVEIRTLKELILFLQDSTPLSQSFAQQGIKISIRKGRRIRHVADRTYSNSAIVDHQRAIDSKNDHEDHDKDAEKKRQSSSTSASASSLTTTDSGSSSGSNSKPNYRRIHISSFLSPPWKKEHMKTYTISLPQISHIPTTTTTSLSHEPLSYFPLFVLPCK